MNELLIQTKNTAFQGFDLGEQQIYIKSKRLPNGIVISTTIVKNNRRN